MEEVAKIGRDSRQSAYHDPFALSAKSRELFSASMSSIPPSPLISSSSFILLHSSPISISCTSLSSKDDMEEVVEMEEMEEIGVDSDSRRRRRKESRRAKWRIREEMEEMVR